MEDVANAIASAESESYAAGFEAGIAAAKKAVFAEWEKSADAGDSRLDRETFRRGGLLDAIEIVGSLTPPREAEKPA